MIIKTDTLQIRFLELIGLLGEATSDENKCFSKVICIPFVAVQTKIFSDENAPLKDKSVDSGADSADYADGNIYPEIYLLKKFELLCLSVNCAMCGAKETIKETKVKKLNLLC